MNTRRFHRSCPRRAFTLIEVLLALFVFTFGLLGLLGVMGGLLGAVSKIEDKHQTADLAGLLQQALRQDATTLQPRAFDDVYKELVNGPVAFLAYTVQTDLTSNATRQTRIVKVTDGISDADLQNLNGPLSKIIVQASSTYRSLSVPTSSGTSTKVTTWPKTADTNPDPFVTVDAFVYVLARPANVSELDLSQKHPDNMSPTRRFSLTLPR